MPDLNTYGPHHMWPVFFSSPNYRKLKPSHTLRGHLTQLFGGKTWSLALITKIEEVPFAEPYELPEEDRR